MRARKGPQQAALATAHKLARIVYHLLRYGDAYAVQQAAAYEEERQARELRHLSKRATSLEYTLLPGPGDATGVAVVAG
jgi:hypothetical protein